MDKKLAHTKLVNGITVTLDYHATSRTAQYEIWVRRIRDNDEYSWKIEAKAQTLPRAKALYESQVAALQAA